MDVHLLGHSFGPPLAPAVLEVPNQFLLLGVNADHRVMGVAVLAGLTVDVPELGVPVRMLVTLDRLDVALKAEVLLLQQLFDRVR